MPFRSFFCLEALDRLIEYKKGSFQVNFARTAVSRGLHDIVFFISVKIERHKNPLAVIEFAVSFVRAIFCTTLASQIAVLDSTDQKSFNANQLFTLKA